MGRFLLDTGRPDEARGYLQEATDSGDPVAARTLADLDGDPADDRRSQQARRTGLRCDAIAAPVRSAPRGPPLAQRLWTSHSLCSRCVAYGSGVRASGRRRSPALWRHGAS
jgi:hypothetical protein